MLLTRRHPLVQINNNTCACMKTVLLNLICTAARTCNAVHHSRRHDLINSRCHEVHHDSMDFSLHDIWGYF